MSEQTKIQWATHTFNPWIGCTKVSPGCANCYAEMTTLARVKRANGSELWGKGAARHRTSAAMWKQPLKWNRSHEQLSRSQSVQFCGVSLERARVFPSLCDWLDDEVPTDWLVDFLALIWATPNMDWLLLTKRPGNFWQQINEAFESPRSIRIHQWLECWERELPRNIWLGVSVEDQKRADERIPELLKIPARVRFLSVEPLLEQIDLSSHLLRASPLAEQFPEHPKLGRKLHWVIVGGESGPKARPCDIGWIRGLGNQCRIYDVPVFVKQLGSNPVAKHDKQFCPACDGNSYPLEVNHPKGGDPAEWPEDLRVREFPKPITL